jgi:hypothetical protein
MTLRAGCIAAALVLLPIAGFAIEMTDPDRAELRERAVSLQAQRAQNPAWDGGTTRLNDSRGEVKLDRPRGDVKLDRPRGDVKTKNASEVKQKRAKSQKPPRDGGQPKE